MKRYKKIIFISSILLFTINTIIAQDFCHYNLNNSWISISKTNHNNAFYDLDTIEFNRHSNEKSYFTINLYCEDSTFRIDNHDTISIPDENNIYYTQEIVCTTGNNYGTWSLDSSKTIITFTILETKLKYQYKIIETEGNGTFLLSSTYYHNGKKITFTDNRIKLTLIKI